MVLNRVREVWKKRYVQNLIKNAGKEDWCTFVRALCNSSKNCKEFPFTCMFCLQDYFKPDEILQCILEKEN